MMTLAQVSDGIAWRTRPLRRAVTLMTTFRNGLALVRRQAGRAVLWNGTAITHPPDRAGFLETLTEVWCDQAYTHDFYVPRAGDVIVDAGANVGLFSIWAAHQRSDCRVVAFEPFRENFETLQTNAEPFANVQTIRAALADRCGRAAMESVGFRSLDHHLIADASGDVPTLDFAGLLATVNAPEIAFMKIDIEGSEFDLFSTARPEHLRRVERFAIEFHDHARPGASALIMEKLGPSHRARMEQSRHGAYGMIYAVRRDE